MSLPRWHLRRHLPFCLVARMGAGRAWAWAYPADVLLVPLVLSLPQFRLLFRFLHLVAVRLLHSAAADRLVVFLKPRRGPPMVYHLLHFLRRCLSYLCCPPWRLLPVRLKKAGSTRRGFAVCVVRMLMLGSRGALMTEEAERPIEEGRREKRSCDLIVEVAFEDSFGGLDLRMS